MNLWITRIKDDPSRGELEQLRLELELVPGWAPGRSMKPPRPAMMVLALPGGISINLKGDELFESL